MDWDKQKTILVLIFIFLISGLTFGLGATFGVTLTKEEFFNGVVPIVSAAGSWVSGIGAVGAVIVALWLAERQRLSEKEDLKVSFNYSVMPTISMDQFLTISIVNKGAKPSSINSISLYSENADTLMQLIRFAPGSSSLPTRIGYGESALFILESNFDIYIAKYLKEHSDAISKNMRVCVNSTVESFKVPVSKELQSKFEKLAISES